MTGEAEQVLAILDAYQPGTLTEVYELVSAKAMLRRGADPADVLARFESESFRDAVAFEQEHGVGAMFDRAWRETLGGSFSCD